MANPILFLARGTDGLTFRDRAGGGLLTPAGAVRYAPAANARTNLVLNPSAEVDVAGWLSGGVTLTSDPAWAAAGSRSFKQVVTAVGSASGVFTATTGAGMMRVTPGVAYTYSLTVYNPNATARSFRIGVLFRDLNNVTKLSDTAGYVTVAAGATAVLSKTNVAPAGSEGAYIVVYADNAGPNPFGNGDVHHFDAVLFEPAASVGSYFDGSTGAWLDPVTGQLGTPHASPSVSRAVWWGPEEGTTNLLLNPSAEVDATTGVAATGATVTRDTAYASNGGASFKVVTSNLAAAEGLTLLSAALARATVTQNFPGQARVRGSGSVQVWVRINYSDATATNGAATNVTLNDTWQLVSPAIPVSDNTKTISGIQLHVRTQTQQAATYWVDSAQVDDNKPYATSYCDGSLGNGYAWTGTAHASSSTRAAARLFFDATGRLNLAKGATAIRFNAFNPLNNTGYLFGFSGAGTSRIYLQYTSTTQKLTAIYGTTPTSMTQAGTTPVGTWAVGGNEWDGANASLYSGASLVGGPAAYTGISGQDVDADIGSFAALTQANAYIDAVAIFERPLTAAEHATLANREAWTWDMLEDTIGSVLNLAHGIVPGPLAIGSGG